MIPHSWILECLELFGAAQNVNTLLEKLHKWLETKFVSKGESLGSFSITIECLELFGAAGWFPMPPPLYGLHDSSVPSSQVLSLESEN